MDEASQHPPYSALVSSRAMTGSQFIVNDGSRRQAARNEPVKDYAPVHQSALKSRPSWRRC